MLRSIWNLFLAPFRLLRYLLWLLFSPWRWWTAPFARLSSFWSLLYLGATFFLCIATTFQTISAVPKLISLRNRHAPAGTSQTFPLRLAWTFEADRTLTGQPQGTLELQEECLYEDVRFYAGRLYCGIKIFDATSGALLGDYEGLESYYQGWYPEASPTTLLIVESGYRLQALDIVTGNVQ